MTGIDGDRDRPEGLDDWKDGDGEPLETERLALDDADDRLPWLEGPEGDGEYDEEEDNSNSRLILFFAMGLLALGALVGGIWWINHRTAAAPLVADGSTVAAPSGPYKEAPKDPGGKTFAGTGDSSFAVSEGQTRQAQLGDATAAAGPSVAIAPTGSPAPKLAPAATSAPAAVPTPKPVAASGGVGVQVGAFSTKAAAEAGWAKLTAQAGGALSGVGHRVIEGTADYGTIFRLQAVAGDRGAAQELCGRLKSKGIACQVK